MSAAFFAAGVLIGALICKASPAEPIWGLLIIPAAAALLVGWFAEEDLRK